MKIIKKHQWHYRLQNYIFFDKGYKTRPYMLDHNGCPYAWLTVLCILLVIPVYIYKSLHGFLNKLSQKVYQNKAKNRNIKYEIETQRLISYFKENFEDKILPIDRIFYLYLLVEVFRVKEFIIRHRYYFNEDFYNKNRKFFNSYNWIRDERLFNLILNTLGLKEKNMVESVSNYYDVKQYIKSILKKYDLRLYENVIYGWHSEENLFGKENLLLYINSLMLKQINNEKKVMKYINMTRYIVGILLLCIGVVSLLSELVFYTSILLLIIGIATVFSIKDSSGKSFGMKIILSAKKLCPEIKIED